MLLLTRSRRWRFASAFFRIWCVVELSAAVLYAKPVVMLIGGAGEASGGFEPNKGMIRNLYHAVDVRKAAASVEADRVRELAQRCGLRSAPPAEPHER